MDQNYLRARYSEEEWNETPAQRKERLRAERFAAQMKNEKTLSLVGPPDDRAYLDAVLTPILDEVSPPKGTCPKCHKHIGTGLYGHMRACKGGEGG